MKQLKQVGFFRELSHGHADSPSLSEQRNDTPLQDEIQILRYLDAGHLTCSAPGLTRDILSPDQKIIGGLAIYSDGTWAWPSDLSYYVRNYHVSLPEEFIEHMKAMKFTCPRPGKSKKTR